MSEVVDLAAALVRIPSHPGVARQEEAVARALAEWLEARGVEVQLDEVAPGRPNLLATVRGTRAGRHLLLCGHTDTVPLNRDDPGFGFSAELVAGELRGRGSVDMKGAARGDGLRPRTARRPAARDRRRDPRRGRRRGDGEPRRRAAGAPRPAAARPPGAIEGAIVGEPTDNRLCLGHKGLEWLEVELLGRAAHGGTPAAGVNAIAAAARFLDPPRRASSRRSSPRAPIRSSARRR